MPELPEVETMRRGVLGAVGARIVAAVRLPCCNKPIGFQPSLRSLRARAVGARVEDVQRVGKRVVFCLNNACRFVFEPRMTGLVLVADPPDHEHLRFRLDLDGGELTHIWYWDRRGLGSVHCLTADEFAGRLGANRLGPDALDISAAELRRRLETGRRAIKVALLDQRAVAGIGNLYAAEILHVARVHPERPCDSLDPSEWRRVHDAQRRVLLEAIRYEGSTLADGTYRNVLSQDGNYQSHHRVYDREGEACRTCRRARIVRIVQAQRATFFCPRCQPLGMRPLICVSKRRVV